MPEEINRILTDAISRWLFVTEPSGVENLRREGVPEDRIFLVGNVMIDTLLACRELSQRSTILEDLGLAGRPYAVLTLHRPANVDDPDGLRGPAGGDRAAPARAADRLPGPPADPQGAGGHATSTAMPGLQPDRAARLPRLHEAGRRTPGSS